MIEASTAITLMLAGAGLMLLGIFFGHLFHMRYLDRKLWKPYPKKPKGAP